jgi:hypothetical protein
MPCHLITVDLKYTALEFLIIQFFHTPVTASDLGPNTLFPNIFRLCSSLNAKDQISHSRK